MSTPALTVIDTGSPPQAAPRRRRTVTLGAIAVLVAALVGLWFGVLRDRIVAKRWGVVEEGAIYRSGQLSRHLVKSMLKQHGIQVVIDLTEADPADVDQQAEQRAIAELGLESHRCVLIGDGTGDIRQYAAAVAALVAAKRDGKPVLVHCHAGAQRTGGVIAAYRLLVERRQSIAAVLAELPRFGWQRGRDDVLLDFLNQHMEELAKLLVEQHVIDDVPAPLPRLAP
ncbi:MAG: dual specificity protein phosphatase family protein [Planctomycetales bacterium]|nr:dual specificity protein phosphatase family protein [Planctomycetales bacterium]